jgi:phosphate transport system ATP-binding protein
MTPDSTTQTDRPPVSDTAPSTSATVTVRSPSPREEAPQTSAHSITLRGLNAYYGETHAVKGVDLDYAANQVTAMIGPSGCGKSTLVRCINRMHEELPGARAEGSVHLDDLDLYGSDVDVVAVRRAIGMVFQKPNPFPTMSIFDNVAAGLRLSGVKGGKNEIRDRVERSLKGAGLWDEVKDRLDAPGIGLSGGQQQRLCIARTIAVEPEVILMDEPCSALDPIATLRIEELIGELKQRYTIVIVTHNMQQAARVADTTAFMLMGELVEHAPTEQIFTKPSDDRTEQYVTGKFG